jgi:phosphoribosyl 1,2-cyclic phosphodiesterase
LLQGGSKTKSFDDFADSPYYRAFVKFGRYSTDTRVINPPRMIDWLLKNNKRIDNWCSDSVYTEYLLHYLQHEVVDDALTRAVEFSVD